MKPALFPLALASLALVMLFALPGPAAEPPVDLPPAVEQQPSADMPLVGDPQAPANQHVVPRYLYESGTEIGIPNVVTSVLASYRGYDTLGETVVIFTAGIAVLLLLRGGHGVRRKREDDPE